MNDGDFALRPEAGPVPYCSLIESQRDALERILKALDEARGQLSTRPYRMSRIFFVSGEPGSGKSSLYYTLREILSGEQPSWEPFKRYEEKYRSVIGRLAPCVRWLDLIDLEVTGDEGENLLAAVLVRIARALENRSGAGSKDCLDAMNQLEVLANDIGIAWDGNLRSRASSLDPDSYSQEVMRAQGARLQVNERLTKALKQLSNGKCYGCSEETLFVLPVDDFYLKPAVSLELLRLLRMISVPRLFFLIMGDEKTMQALFLEKALADWTAIAGPQVFAALEKRQPEVLSRAREMSARYFRKLLPVGQRAVLKVMTPKEALRYKPSFENPTQNVPTLSELLSETKIRKTLPFEDSNLFDFLTTTKTEKSLRSRAILANSEGNGADRIKHLEEGYSALQILEAGPREVTDLWKSIHGLPKSQCSPTGNTPVYLETLLQIAIRTLEEQDFLPEDLQELLRSAFPISYDAGPVETHKLELTTKRSGGTRVPSEFITFFVRTHSGWVTRIPDIDKAKDKGAKDKGNGAFLYLPPRQTAWIILLHDLSVECDSSRSISENLVDKVRNSLDESVVEPRSETLGWAWWQRGPGEENQNWFHLPFPELNTLRQLDRFLAFWTWGLSARTLTWDYLVRLWIKAGWVATGLDDHCYENVDIDENDSVINGSEGSWEKILENVKSKFNEFAGNEDGKQE